MRSLKPYFGVIASVMVFATLACQAVAPKTTQSPENPLAPSEAVVEQPTQVQLTEQVMETSAVATQIVTQSSSSTVEKPAETASPSLPTLPPPQLGPEQLDLTKIPAEHGFSDFTEGYQIDMQWTDPQDAKVEIDTTYTYRQQTLPSAAWYYLFDDQNPFLASKIESAVIGQQGFSATPETGCQLVSADQLKNEDPRSSFRSLLENLTGQVIRAETDVDLDGSPTDLYTLEAANLKPEAEIVIKAASAGSSGELSQSVSTTFKLMEKDTSLDSGKLYLAQQGGYVRRIELNYSKTATEDDAPFAKPGARMERALVYDVVVATSLDQPVAMPAGCEGSSGVIETGNNNGVTHVEISDLPRPTDISNVVEAEGSLVYQTNTSLEAVLDFYRTEMPAQGWEKTEEIAVGTIATFEFTRGDQNASITMIQTGGSVTVTIDLT